MTDAQNSPAGAPSRPAPRSADQIESDLDAARQRLAGTIETLSEKVKPENLAKEGIAKVKGIFFKPDGGVRVERVAATAAVLVGVIVVRQGLSSWSRKRSLSRLPDVVYLPVPRSQLGA